MHTTLQKCAHPVLSFCAHAGADAARERTAQYLLMMRLEKLREQAAARNETDAAASWTDRLPELAARPLDDNTAGAVIA